MKRRLCITMLMGMALLLLINGIAFGAGHEEPGGTLAGPPLVGTLTLDPVSCPVEDCCLAYDGSKCTRLMIYVKYKFTGCCAECSEASCKPSCNVKMSKFEDLSDPIIVSEHDGLGGLTLGDAIPENIETYSMTNLMWLPTNCNSDTKNIFIDKVLKMRPTDLDNDGVTELLADIIVLYVK